MVALCFSPTMQAVPPVSTSKPTTTEDIVDLLDSAAVELLEEQSTEKLEVRMLFSLSCQ